MCCCGVGGGSLVFVQCVCCVVLVMLFCVIDFLFVLLDVFVCVCVVRLLRRLMSILTFDIIIGFSLYAVF